MFQLAGMIIMEKPSRYLKPQNYSGTKCQNIHPWIGLKPTFLVHTSFSCRKFLARADVCSRLASTFCTQNKELLNSRESQTRCHQLVSCTLKFLAEEMIYQAKSFFCIEFIYWIETYISWNKHIPIAFSKFYFILFCHNFHSMKNKLVNS